MKPLRRALVLLTATAATLAPTAAFAQTYTHTDTSHDVKSENIDTGTLTPEPTHAEGDITSTTVAHKAHKVVVTLRYAQLSRTTQLTGHVVELKTNTGKVRVVELVAGPNHWRGKTLQVTGQGKRWRCATTHTIDYDNDTVRIGVPRRCLGNPRWVQAGVGAVSEQSQKFFEDDAQSSAVGNDLVLGPKVFRG